MPSPNAKSFLKSNYPAFYKTQQKYFRTVVRSTGLVKFKRSYRKFFGGVAAQKEIARERLESFFNGLPASQARTIVFPTSEQPIISVIIACYGKLGLTLQCLQSIAKNPPKTSFEIIVVDDAYSGAEDLAPLKEVSGIRLIRNAVNLGYLRSCNVAALQARGKYLYFLNNDTIVRFDTIDALHQTLEQRTDAGMVGSKLLFADGTLQEAGGIVWSDASAWNYGRGENPNRHDFNYVREVDYCSGASLMIGNDLFRSLGCFDEIYVPAYYEDTDLAFRIREKGFKVLYQPASELIHLEGMSYGKGEAAEEKPYQEKNRHVMEARWRSVLQEQHFANGKHLIKARDRAGSRKTILVLDHYVTKTDEDAGSRSTQGILESLLDAGWNVKFWPENRIYEKKYTPLMEAIGIEVIDSRYAGDLRTWLRDNRDSVDFLFVSRPTVAANMLTALMDISDIPWVFYGHDLHFARMRRQAVFERDGKLAQEADKIEKLERRIWRIFDLVIYPSEEEAAHVRKLDPAVLARAIVPFAFDVAAPANDPPANDKILFVAGFAHPPNVDAARFLVKEVLPLLEAELARSVELTLAGSYPTDSVKALATDRIKVTGYVTEQELDELYRSHRVAVVPLRFGAGVKGKLVQALCKGIPVVTTPIGVQGIPGLSEIIPVSEAPAAIASALKLLLTDDQAWRSQAHAQTAFARENFSHESMKRSVISAFQQVEAVATPDQQRWSDSKIANLGARAFGPS